MGGALEEGPKEGPKERGRYDGCGAANLGTVLYTIFLSTGGQSNLSLPRWTGRHEWQRRKWREEILEGNEACLPISGEDYTMA